MSILLWSCLALLLAAHGYRTYWTLRRLPQVQTGAFSGDILQVGATYIARRPARSNPATTLICFPGFLEDMRYFQHLYETVECELILVNNADYHCPFPTAAAQTLDWPENPYRLGTIEYDGFRLAQIVERLAGGTTIVLHGHSRGGAVVLEAGRQFPALMRRPGYTVNAILEAAVLPQARTAGRGSEAIPHYLLCYFLPLVLGLARRDAVAHLRKQPMMQPCSPLKLEVCSAIYTNPRHYSTCIVNARSIRQWQAVNDEQLFRNFAHIDVVLGERDDVLDNPSMLSSAQRGRACNAAVNIVRTDDSNHFPTLEQPDILRNLAGEAGA